MKQKVIIHNSISLDGSFLNFNFDMGLHYQIAGSFKPDAHLIGSVTAKTGLETYGGEIAKEEKQDFQKPKKDKKLPYWVIVDTKGILKGLLHAYRRFEFCRDVIILASKRTPKAYLAYLKERNYDYYIAGDKFVDFKKAFLWLESKYKTKTILTDTGRTLADILISKDLVDEISLLVYPVIVGSKSENLFEQIDKIINLKLVKNEVLNKNYLWLIYKIEEKESGRKN